MPAKDGASLGRLYSISSMASNNTVSTSNTDSLSDLSVQDFVPSGRTFPRLPSMRSDDDFEPPFLLPGPLCNTDEELGYSARKILDYWKKKERTSQKTRKIHLGCAEQIQRRHTVDWLSNMGDDLNLQPVTIQSALSIFDEVLGSRAFTYRDWKLLAICSLNVAAKYEEAELNMPMVSDIAQVSETVLTTRSVTQGELRLAKALDWNLSRVTPMHFLGYYIHGGVIFDGDLCQGRRVEGRVFKYVKKYVNFFANLSQQDHSFLKYLPSILAAGVIMATRQVLCIFPLWREELVYLTGYSENDIVECKNELWGCYVCMFPNHCALRMSEVTSDSAPSSSSPDHSRLRGRQRTSTTFEDADSRKTASARFHKFVPDIVEGEAVPVL